LSTSAGKEADGASFSSIMHLDKDFNILVYGLDNSSAPGKSSSSFDPIPRYN